MVGDTPFDARAATGCGVKAIGVLTGGFEYHELVVAGCTAVFPSLRPFSLGPTGQPTRLLSVQAVADLLARRFAAGTLRQIPRQRRAQGKGWLTYSDKPAFPFA
jgi:hypothetical protein